MNVNDITTLEQLKECITDVGIDYLPISAILLSFGWIDERYMKRGICRIGNKRLSFNAHRDPVITIVDTTTSTRSAKGKRRHTSNISLRPELYAIVDGVANRSRFISDAILFYRNHAQEYMGNGRTRLSAEPGMKYIKYVLSNEATLVVKQIDIKQQYICDAIKAYAGYKQQYV